MPACCRRTLLPPAVPLRSVTPLLRPARPRPFSSSARRRQEAAIDAAAAAGNKRPIGAARGGLLGFLLGIVAVGAVGAGQLVAEYKAASQAMLASVDDLKASALQLSSFLKRIEALEKEVRHLRLTSIDRDDLDRLTSDTKRLTDSSYIELLDLKTSLLDLENEVALLAKHAGTRIRI